MEIYRTQKAESKGKRILLETERDVEMRSRMNFVIFLIFFCFFNYLFVCFIYCITMLFCFLLSFFCSLCTITHSQSWLIASLLFINIIHLPKMNFFILIISLFIINIKFQVIVFYRTRVCNKKKL